MEKIRNFKDLMIWQKGITIVKDIYAITKSYPKEETFGLCSQMRRSAVSIPSNIAEGFRRIHNKEYRQFLYITLGSAAELETQLIISKELDYISEDELSNSSNDLIQLSKMTKSLINKL